MTVFVSSCCHWCTFSL